MGRHAMVIVRPGGRSSPPAGFLCSQLTGFLHLAAVASGQTNTSVVSRGGFYMFAYRGQHAERSFPPDVPTCSRLLMDNPSNVAGRREPVVAVPEISRR